MSEEVFERMTFREYCRRAKNWFDQRKLIVYQNDIFSSILDMVHQALLDALRSGPTFQLILIQVL